MSHVPFHRMIGDVHVVNVGSIGEAPDGLGRAPVFSEKQRPLVAHATWIESTPAGVHVEQIKVPLVEPESLQLRAV
jgi:hypothetical protein